MRLLFIISFLHVLDKTLAKELKFVQAVWRHGHRAPGGLPYPNDKNDLNVWKRGWSQLTPLGMQQLKELGDFFEERYRGKFTSKRFNVSEIYVKASDADRAIESAQSFLQGFYPAEKDEMFEKGLLWRPLPVHTSGPDQVDLVLRPTSYPCALYDKMKSHLEFRLMLNLSKQYPDVYRFLKNMTGVPTEKFRWADAIHVASASRELEYNLTVDPWLFKRWPKHGGRTTLEIAQEWARLSRFIEWATPEMVKMRGGVMLHELLRTINKVAKGEQSHPKKMLLYSAHDGTVMTLLNSLKLKVDQITPYGSAVIMEVFKEENQFYVELLYRKSKMLQAVQVPGCDVKCPVDKLHNLLVKNIVESRKKLDILCENNLK